MLVTPKIYAIGLPLQPWKRKVDYKDLLIQNQKALND